MLYLYIIYLHSGLKFEKRGNLGKGTRNAISSQAKFNRFLKKISSVPKEQEQNKKKYHKTLILAFDGIVHPLVTR